MFPSFAAGAVAVLTATNVLGIRTGTAAQNLLTAIKVIGILALVGIGLAATGVAADPRAAPPRSTNIELAFILVMYTYGGWNVIVLVAAEVRDAKRTIVHALLLGLGAVTGIYVLAVAAFEHALGHTRLGNSGSAAADVAFSAFGAHGSTFISVLICITCLANINATVLANSRIFYAFGRRWPAFGWLGSWHPQRAAPVNALIAQGVVAITLIFVLAAGEDSFRRLVVFSAPVFWVFFLLVSIALFVFRRRGIGSSDGFRVPLYPVLPLAFSGICAFMLYASIDYAVAKLAGEALAILGLLAAGIAGSFVTRERPSDRTP